MRKVYLEPSGRPYNLFDELVECPPPGYQFAISSTRWDQLTTRFLEWNAGFWFTAHLLRRLVPLHLSKAYVESFSKRRPPDAVLTYAIGHPIFRREPWILDLEWVTQLGGFYAPHLKRYRRVVEKTLASSYCRRILCWLEETRRGLLRNLDCSSFEHKVDVVYRAIRPKQFHRTHTDDKIKLLFVGSGYVPGEFENKGGREVLVAFSELSKQYSNIELVVRSFVPPEIKKRYCGARNLRIIDWVIPREELEEHFRTADIFLMPAYHTPGMVILEAMAYELPVITINSLGNGELVTHGETGIVVSFTDRPEYYVLHRAPNPDIRTVLRDFGPDRVAVQGIVEAVRALVEDPDLRRRMGRAARWEVENGRFSIARRNDKLKRVFDEAIDGSAGQRVASESRIVQESRRKLC